MSNSIKCTLLPLSQERYLILPNTSLAEVVDNRSDLLVMGARDGIIGKIQWRGHSVPLVSYEAAIGEIIPGHGQDARIAVVFSPSGDSALPYIAFSVQGVPKLIQAQETDFVSINGEENNLVAHHVEVEGNTGMLPNMQLLETFVKMRLN